MMEPLRTVLTPMARERLRVAHLEYDLYFRGFLHNHLCHGIVSLTAVIAATTSNNSAKEEENIVTVVSDEEMKAHYSEQIKMYETRHRETAPSAEVVCGGIVVTTENWYERVLQPGGGVNMSGNFLNFFDEEIIKYKKKNDDDKTVLSHMLTKYALDPRIVSRILGGAVHPLIHLGFACELFAMEPETSKLLLVEALAMQCTTRDQFRAVLESLEPLSVVNEKEPPLTREDGAENRVLQVLHEMQQDEALVNVPTPENPDKVDYIISRTDVMSKYYNSFPVSESSPESVQLAFEQLFFAALTIAFGSIPPTKEETDARLDFFLVHLLTSAVSLRQVLPYLDPKAGAALCRLHFCAILVWYRARGHPSLNMKNMLKLPTTLTWDACEAKLRENPSMEVHALKVFRALQLVKSEDWAQRALHRSGGGGGGLLSGMTTEATTTKTAPADSDKDVWLICANVLVQNVERDSEFPWLFKDAWDYYNS